jgi:DNA helicase-2/ATP-dependent DNA helicase PcrA
MDFPKKYPDTKICKLEYNYRSSPQILDFANEVITFNERQFKKILKPVKEHGLHPHLIAPQNVFQQSTFVANQIQECIYNGIPADEIAILYRAHYHSMELQMELTRRNIQFEVRSGIRFFEQAHIKDIVSYLKILLNPLDEVAWNRLLLMMPGIGSKTAQKIFSLISKSDNPIKKCTESEIISKVPKAAKTYWPNFQNTLLSLSAMGTENPPANLIKYAFENGYLDYLRAKYTDSMGRNEDIEQFISFAWKFENLTDLLSELALITSSESEETENQTEQKIKLTTIHQAKGLEWSVVFIICLVEGRFPNAQNIKDLEEEEEERRLFYVASTRAKDHLFLCVPKYIKDSNGYANIAKPSRFLREIPEECYKVINEEGYYDTYY